MVFFLVKEYEGRDKNLLLGFGSKDFDMLLDDGGGVGGFLFC